MVTLWLLSEHRFGRAGKRHKKPQSVPVQKGDIDQTTVKQGVLRVFLLEKRWW
ncbi:MAG: hypothetical protein AAB676_19680 [Verrucomicrobiota bacterium]